MLSWLWIRLFLKESRNEFTEYESKKGCQKFHSPHTYTTGVNWWSESITVLSKVHMYKADEFTL